MDVQRITPEKRKRIVRDKRKRLETGEKPRVLDLFSGCGGLSLGFHTAGYQLVAAVENDPLAIKSHAHNFFGPEHAFFEEHSTPRDVTQTDPAEVFDGLGLKTKPEKSIDVLVGGPPCQAFARVGRAKLREVDRDPHAFLNDPRGNLYLAYLHYVRELCPLALLMENVPDSMNVGGRNIAQEICEVLGFPPLTDPGL